MLNVYPISPLIIINVSKSLKKIDVDFTVLRDTKERGRDIENILHQYTTLVKPAFEEFCLPVKDFIICIYIYKLLLQIVNI